MKVRIVATSDKIKANSPPPSKHKTNNILYRRQTFYKLVSGLVRRIIRRHFARNTPRARVRLINTANLFSPLRILIKTTGGRFDKSLMAR